MAKKPNEFLDRVDKRLKERGTYKTPETELRGVGRDNCSVTAESTGTVAPLQWTVCTAVLVCSLVHYKNQPECEQWVQYLLRSLRRMKAPWKRKTERAWQGSRCLLTDGALSTKENGSATVHSTADRRLPSANATDGSVMMSDSGRKKKVPQMDATNEAHINRKGYRKSLSELSSVS